MTTLNLETKPVKKISSYQEFPDGWMKIEDDFLNQEKFDELQNLMMSVEFAWYFSDVVDYEWKKDKFMFVHLFWMEGAPRSTDFVKVAPILQKMNPLALWRIKANLLTKTPTIVENEFHIDIGDASEEKLAQWTTSIFYINTNNGYTKFENGVTVQSVANRMVTFPSHMKHAGTSCTDEKTRVVINFNYFK